MEIRQFREGDEYGVRALFELVFGKELHEEEWLWKYRFSPWGSASTVAIKDGLIIAHYGGVRLQFCEGQRNYMAYQLCDVMTHPSYRALSLLKKGTFVKTALLFGDLETMDLVFGFPSERHARLTTIMLSGEKHRFVSTLFKPVSEPAGRRSFLLSVEHGWDNIKGQEIDSLWNKVRDDYALTINKISRYIFWRYRDCPTRQYELLIFRSKLSSRIKGYAVVAFRDNEMQVLDFFYKKGFGIERLFRDIEIVAGLRKAERVKLWVNPGEKIFHIFKAMGYMEEQGVPITCRIMNRDVPMVPDFFFEKYSYRMGDYDAS
jgi:hypothetical protein